MECECSNTPSLSVGSVEFQDFRPKVPAEPHAGGHDCAVTDPQGGFALGPWVSYSNSLRLSFLIWGWK